jgi:hypothetical protein
MFYDWTVPTPIKNKMNCLVKVIGYDASDKKVGADKSDSTFTIEVVKVTSPDGGETLTGGGLHTITWQTNVTKKPVEKVVLSYTKNGGRKWKKIETIVGSNPGTYAWTVPVVTKIKSKCKVKVVLKDAKGNTVGSDTSDGYFTLGFGPLDVTGHWKVSEVPPEMALVIFALEQTDSTVSGVASDMSITGTVSDDTLTWRGQYADPGTYDIGTMTRTGPDELCGTVDVYEGDVLIETFTVCLVRCYLSGVFTAVGTIDGQAIDVDTLADGWGGVVGTGGVAEYVRFGYVTPDLGLTFRVSPAENVAVGTFTVVPNPIAQDQLSITLQFATPAESGGRFAASGSVVIDKFDATGFMATFDLDFGAGDVLVGSFDVPWDILVGDPFL